MAAAGAVDKKEMKNAREKERVRLYNTVIVGSPRPPIDLGRYMCAVLAERHTPDHFLMYLVAIDSSVRVTHVVGRSMIDKSHVRRGHTPAR